MNWRWIPYPDSICVDGQLFDADNCDDQGNLYEPAEYIPCPMREPQAAINWRERNQLRGTAVRAARKAAESLVADIRKNRDAPPPILR